MHAFAALPLVACDFLRIQFFASDSILGRSVGANADVNVQIYISLLVDWATRPGAATLVQSVSIFARERYDVVDPGYEGPSEALPERINIEVNLLIRIWQRGLDR